MRALSPVKTVTAPNLKFDQNNFTFRHFFYRTLYLCVYWLVASHWFSTSYHRIQISGHLRLLCAWYMSCIRWIRLQPQIDFDCVRSSAARVVNIGDTWSNDVRGITNIYFRIYNTWTADLWIRLLSISFWRADFWLTVQQFVISGGYFIIFIIIFIFS